MDLATSTTGKCKNTWNLLDDLFNCVSNRLYSFFLAKIVLFVIFCRDTGFNPQNQPVHLGFVLSHYLSLAWTTTTNVFSCWASPIHHSLAEPPMSPQSSWDFPFSGSQRPVNPLQDWSQVKLYNSFSGHWFHVCLSLDSKQRRLAFPTGSIIVSLGPGIGGHCEITDKGTMEGREQEALTETK